MSSFFFHLFHSRGVCDFGLVLGLGLDFFNSYFTSFVVALERDRETTH